MDRRLIVGILVAIIVIVGLGAYVSIQNPGAMQLGLTNGSNGTDSLNGVNSGVNQNSNNQINQNAGSGKQNVSAKRVICPGCHGTGWDYCMGCHGTGLETCSACGGDGTKVSYIYINGKKVAMKQICIKCHGAGKIKCTICGGTGGKTKCGACGGDGYIDPGDKGYSGGQ